MNFPAQDTNRWKDRLLGAGLGAAGMAALGMGTDWGHDIFDQVHELDQNDQLIDTGVNKINELWNTAKDKISNIMPENNPSPESQVVGGELQQPQPQEMPSGPNQVELLKTVNPGDELYGQNVAAGMETPQQSIHPSVLKDISPEQEAVGEQVATGVQTSRSPIELLNKAAALKNVGPEHEAVGEQVATGIQTPAAPQSQPSVHPSVLKNIGAHDEAIGQQQALGVNAPQTNKLEAIAGGQQPSVHPSVLKNVQEPVTNQPSKTTQEHLAPKPQPQLRNEPVQPKLNKEYLHKPESPTHKLTADTTADSSFENWKNSMFRFKR